MKKSFLSLILVACMALTLLPIAAEGEITPAAVVEVSTFSELKAAFGRVEAGENDTTPAFIIVKADIAVENEIDQSYHWGGGQNKVLLSDGIHTISRLAGYTGSMFKIRELAKLQIGGIDSMAGYTFGPITFDGNNPGGNTETMFKVEGSAVMDVREGTFQNCNTNGGQGVFRVWGPTLTLGENVTIINNISSGNGAGVFAHGGAKININGTSFINNVSNDRGGAISAEGGSKVTVNGGYFAGNDAAYGGSLINLKGDYNWDSPENSNRAVFTVENITVDNAGYLEIRSSLIHVRDVATAVIKKGTISNTTKRVVELSPYPDNIPGVAQAIIGTTDQSIEDLTFTNCSNSSDAGVIFGGKGDVIINKAKFTNCSSNDKGGVVFSERIGTVTINGGYFENCSTTSGGGVIYSKDGGTVTINDGTFKNCSAEAGGVLCSTYDSVAVINGGIFENCHANYGGAIQSNRSTLTVNGGVFDGCASPSGGDAVLSEGDNGVLNFMGGSIKNCTDYAINFKGLDFNMGGSAKIDAAGKGVRLEGDRLINIASNLTTNGLALTVSTSGDGRQVLKSSDPDMLANNSVKFAAFKDGGGVAGVDTDGKVKYSLTAPEPEAETPEGIVLSYNAGSNTITVDIGSASIAGGKLIAAAYDVNKKLIDVADFDVDFTTEKSQSYPVSDKFTGSDVAKIKVMLWNGFDTITPLVDVYSL